MSITLPPLPRPGPLGLIQYAGSDMQEYAAAVSAAKDAEIAGLRAELLKSLADNAALRKRVRELTTQAMFNTSTIERLRAEAAGLREWLEADARCPCCDTTDACVEGCTFATDCPQDAERMAEVRALLAARKGEA